MDASAIGDFLRIFSELSDPRRDNRRYLLCDIILLAVSAVMCGCEGWQDIEDWTEDAFPFLRALMQQPQHGTPSADTFRRVFVLCGLDRQRAAGWRNEAHRHRRQGAAAKL